VILFGVTKQANTNAIMRIKKKLVNGPRELIFKCEPLEIKQWSYLTLLIVHPLSFSVCVPYVIAWQEKKLDLS